MPKVSKITTKSPSANEILHGHRSLKQLEQKISSAQDHSPEKRGAEIYFSSFHASCSNMIFFSHPIGKTLSLHQTNVGRPVTRGSVGGYFSVGSFSLFLTLCQSSGTGIIQKLLLLFLAKGYHDDRCILPFASNQLSALSCSPKNNPQRFPMTMTAM